MESKYWLDKWTAKDTQFHRDLPNARMTEFFAKLPPGKVVVPLCGKSLDMVWLAKQGHQVMGFELSELACEAFFAENQLSFKKEKLGSGTLYKGERITIYCGDIFESPVSLWEKATALYDRAALVALPADMRKKYAALIIARFKKSKGAYLLITVRHPLDETQGPPFSISQQEIPRLFAADFKIRELGFIHDDSLSYRPGKFEKVEVQEFAHELKGL